MRGFGDICACLGIYLYGSWLLSVLFGVSFLDSMLVFGIGLIAIVGSAYFAAGVR